VKPEGVFCRSVRENLFLGSLARVARSLGRKPFSGAFVVHCDGLSPRKGSRSEKARVLSRFLWAFCQR